MPLNRKSMAEEIANCYLSHRRAGNSNDGVMAEENAVIDRMITRRDELARFYEELYDGTREIKSKFEGILDVIIVIFADFGQNRVKEFRSHRDELRALKGDIGRRAIELSEMLEKYQRLSDEAGFHSNIPYHICSLLEAAGAKHHLFEMYVAAEVAALRGKYHRKYWPTIPQVIGSIGGVTAFEPVEATDPLTRVAIDARKPGLADCFKVLLVGIEERARTLSIPNGLRLTDEAVSLIGSVGFNENVDSAYVKRLRQRERER